MLWVIRAPEGYGLWIMCGMGFGTDFSANRVGSPKNLWIPTGYGVSQVWIRTGTTVKTRHYGFATQFFSPIRHSPSTSPYQDSRQISLSLSFAQYQLVTQGRTRKVPDHMGPQPRSLLEGTPVEILDLIMREVFVILIPVTFRLLKNTEWST